MTTRLNIDMSKAIIDLLIIDLDLRYFVLILMNKNLKLSKSKKIN